MLSDRGYTDAPLPYNLNNRDMLELFPAKYPPRVDRVLARMGHWGFGIGEVARMAGVREGTLRLIIFGMVTPDSVSTEFAAIEHALQLDAVPVRRGRHR